jgi:Spy/CpxP family protein refolding chaperone
MTRETDSLSRPTPSPRRSWRWLALGLPALALSGAFATTALARGGDHGFGGPGGPPNEQQMERFMGRRLERMLDHLNATPAQETQIKAVFASHKEQLKAMHQEKRLLHEATRAALTAPTLDAATVEGVRSKMLAQADKSSRVFADIALQIGQILTQAQRQQMAEHMEHAGGHGPGPGGPFGF